MLVRVEMRNFRCLRSVAVPLRPLTVLIGPNDSGKSAFLTALDFLVNGNQIQLHDHWRQDPKAVAVVTGVTQDSQNGPESTWTNHQGVSTLRPVGFFHLPSQGVSMESPGYPDHSGPQPIQPNGTGVPGLLDYLLRRDRKRFNRVVTTLRDLVPGMEEVEIATPDASSRRVDLVIENGLRLPADRASAGVRLLLFFVALAYHPSPPRLILLEEPETGVHPRRLADVMRLLREVTQGKHGGEAAQVILTTHSPYLLDLIDLEQDQVLVFRRNDDGSRTAEPADAARLQTFLDEFLLGEVWYNQGEEGLVARRA